MPEHSNKPQIVRWMMKMPMMLTCREFEDFVLQYIENELPTYQKFKFEFHIRVCKECHDYLAAYQLSINSAKEAHNADQVELPPVPEELVEAILAVTKK